MNLYLEWVVLSIDGQDWNFNFVHFAPEHGVVVVLVDVLVSEGVGSEQAVELPHRVARQHRLRVKVAHLGRPSLEQVLVLRERAIILTFKNNLTALQKIKKAQKTARKFTSMYFMAFPFVWGKF